MCINYELKWKQRIAEKRHPSNENVEGNLFFNRWAWFVKKQGYNILSIAKENLSSEIIVLKTKKKSLFKNSQKALKMHKKNMMN